jgi:hypothetical protein
MGIQEYRNTGIREYGNTDRTVAVTVHLKFLNFSKAFCISIFKSSNLQIFKLAICILPVLEKTHRLQCNPFLLLPNEVYLME